MSKRHFIALAQTIKRHNEQSLFQFTEEQLRTLADFCQAQNSAFNRERWLGYIEGKNGPNGGRTDR